MKRYIEIVYDNSGSMNNRIGNKRKFEIAQELFEKEILPTIALDNDEVVLRLFGKGCGAENSHSESLTSTYGNNRNEMLSRIKTITHNRNTPLYFTIADSINECKQIDAIEHLIFVLTDGYDNCSINYQELISQADIDKYVKHFKILLVQFAIDAEFTSNNLVSLTSYLGGQAISLECNDTISEMRSKLKKALKVSGFSTKLPLDHCFKTLPDSYLSWENIEKIGIDFHQALLLYNKKVLSWVPDLSCDVDSLQLAELKFLFGLYFKTMLPEDLILTMLGQLKTPYYYSHECIYWDFYTARWKYFIPQNETKYIPDTESNYESALDKDETTNKVKINYVDILDSDNLNKVVEPPLNRDNLENYDGYKIYRVELAETLDPTYYLRPMDDFDFDYNYILKPGDLVKFKRR